MSRWHQTIEATGGYLALFLRDPAVAARLLAWLMLIGAVVAAYRWIRGESRLLASLFAAGVIVRAVGGAALFLISLFQVPVFGSLQLGDGFWALALDGRSYYDMAADAAAQGLASIPDTAPSLLYLRVLAAWMWVFGVTPPSALLLNVACYAISAVLIVATARLLRPAPAARRTGTFVTLAAVTVSPALLMFGTQPLKDPLCALLMTIAMAGASAWWATAEGTPRRPVLATVSGVLLLAIGVFGLAGIRAYMAFLTIAALAVAGAYSVVLSAHAKPRWHGALRQVAILGLLWVVFAVGAGSEYRSYQSFVASLASTPSMPLVALDRDRARFVARGGATSLDEAPDRQAKTPRLKESKKSKESKESKESTKSGVKKQKRARYTPVDLGPLDELPESAPVRLAYSLRGYAALFIPISMLRAASIVTFSGGQGLLAITDLDTIVTDLAVLASLGLLVRSLRGQRLSPAVVFALVLATLTTAALGYVVTNYGTLFRLRMLGVMPLWMLPVMMPGARPAGEDDALAR